MIFFRVGNEPEGVAGKLVIVQIVLYRLAMPKAGGIGFVGWAIVPAAGFEPASTS
jgi:hypothetical protein